MSQILFGLIAVALCFGGSAQVCEHETGGTCRFWGCDSSRGPTTCDGGQCACSDDACASKGACYPTPTPPPAGNPEGGAPTPPPAPSPPTPNNPEGGAPAPSLTDRCKAAYSDQCYTLPPFNDCCQGGDCQGGDNSLECNWAFELPCCKDLLDGSFKYKGMHEGLEDSACMKACKKLGTTSNLAIDYCPDGSHSLWNDIDIAACPEARKSLQKTMETIPKWCNDDHQNTCHWSFHVNLVGKKDTTTASGKFKFKDNSKCIPACDALGDASNDPNLYCGGNTALANKLSGCPEAEASYASVRPGWCGGDGAGNALDVLMAEQPPVGRREIVKASKKRSQMLHDRMLDANKTAAECAQAFQDGCWKVTPFDKCCGQCTNAQVSHQCSWKFSFNDNPIGFTVVSYPGNPWEQCDDFCDILGKQSNDPYMYCDADKIETMALKMCKQAVGQWRHLQRSGPKWCKPPEPSAAAMVAPEVGQTAVHKGFVACAVALMVGVGVAISSRARSYAGADNYQPFLE